MSVFFFSLCCFSSCRVTSEYTFWLRVVLSADQANSRWGSVFRLTWNRGGGGWVRSCDFGNVQSHSHFSRSISGPPLASVTRPGSCCRAEKNVLLTTTGERIADRVSGLLHYNGVGRWRSITNGWSDEIAVQFHARAWRVSFSPCLYSNELWSTKALHCYIVYRSSL